LVFEHVSGQSFLHIKYQPTGCAADEVLIIWVIPNIKGEEIHKSLKKI